MCLFFERRVNFSISNVDFSLKLLNVDSIINVGPSFFGTHRKVIQHLERFLNS